MRCDMRCTRACLCQRHRRSRARATHRRRAGRSSPKPAPGRPASAPGGGTCWQQYFGRPAACRDGSASAPVPQCQMPDPPTSSNDGRGIAGGGSRDTSLRDHAASRLSGSSSRRSNSADKAMRAIAFVPSYAARTLRILLMSLSRRPAAGEDFGRKWRKPGAGRDRNAKLPSRPRSCRRHRAAVKSPRPREARRDRGQMAPDQVDHPDAQHAANVGENLGDFAGRGCFGYGRDRIGHQPNSR